MKKILAVLCAFGLLLTAACTSSSEDDLSKDKIYFFYQTTCPHCHDHPAYIKKNYPTLKMRALDIKLPGNMRLFEKAVKRYKISGPTGTPLLLMGDNYLMGWSESEQMKFDLYVKPYLE